MKFILSFLAIFFFVTSLSAQLERAMAIASNQQKLHNISVNYVSKQPNDEYARKLIRSYEAVEKEMRNYVEKNAGQSFSTLNEYITAKTNVLSSRDPKLKEMQKKYISLSKKCKEYFSEKDSEYSAILESFRSEMRAGVYGKSQRRKRNKK